MNIPDSATLIVVLAALDGVSMILIAISDTGEQIRFELEQRVYQAISFSRQMHQN